jgi:hypothetical protein
MASNPKPKIKLKKKKKKKKKKAKRGSLIHTRRDITANRCCNALLQQQCQQS